MKAKSSRLGYDLYLIIMLSIALTIIIFIGDNKWLYYVKAMLGMLYSFLFPGYALTAVVFPKKDDLGVLERVTLGCILSIVMIMLIGFVLNYSPWGIKMVSAVIVNTAFTIGMSGLALYRREKLPPSERHIPVFTVSLSGLKDTKFFRKAFWGLILLGFIVSGGSVLYIMIAPKPVENFTEFYMLGENGKADDYPKSLAVGEHGKVIIGIVNNENITAAYHIQVNMGGYKKSVIGPITLMDGQTWENYVEFFAHEPHEKLKVDFLLFREEMVDGVATSNFDMVYKLKDKLLSFLKVVPKEEEKEDRPYRSLYLWVNFHK